MHFAVIFLNFCIVIQVLIVANGHILYKLCVAAGSGVWPLFAICPCAKVIPWRDTPLVAPGNDYDSKSINAW